jgi:hypothetical protein
MSQSPMPAEEADTKPSVSAPDSRVVFRAALTFTAILLLINAITVVPVHSHLRAAGPAIIFVNFLALVSGLALVGWVKRRSGGAPLDSYALAVVGGPLLAWGLDVVIIQAWTLGF